MLSAGIELHLPHYSLGLEVRGNLPSHQTVPEGGTISTWQLVGAVVPCYRVGLFSGCGLIGVGAQWASGQGLQPSMSQITPYFAIGARIAADLPLESWLWVRPEVDLWVPTNRTTLTVADVFVWRTPAASPVVAVALVAALP
jgi:hypothetical protein